MSRSEQNPASGAHGYGRLDRQVILDAALRVAARPGAAEVRFRDLGEELGSDPTAVYRHFRNKRHLMEALIDRLMDDVARDIQREGDWRTVLSSTGAALLEQFSRHPAIGLHLAEARPVGGAELGLVEVTLRALEDAGLSDGMLIEHYGALSGFFLSYIAAACRELVTTGGTSATEIEGISWLPDHIEVTAETHPMLVRYGERLAAMHFRSAYFSALDVLIDAIAAAGRSRRPQAG